MSGMLKFQQDVAAWCRRCFGLSVYSNRSERAHRFCEEALELVQAAGVSKDEVRQLLNYVFDRPVGELKQEVGGTMVTLAAMCQVYGIKLNEAATQELHRCELNIEKIRLKHASKPSFGPLPGSVDHHSV